MLDVAKGARADEEIIAVGKKLHAEKAGVREVSGELAHEVRAEVDLICVAEALSDKRYALTVRRPRWAFAERNQLRDIWRQILFRRARLARLATAIARGNRDNREAGKESA